MNNNIFKLVISCVFFFGAYVLVDYLIDSKIQWDFAVVALVCYAIFSMGISLKNKNK